MGKRKRKCVFTSKKAKNMKLQRCNESPNASEKRKEKKRIANSASRIAETPDKKAERQEKERISTSTSRVAETPDKRAERQEKQVLRIQGPRGDL